MSTPLHGTATATFDVGGEPHMLIVPAIYHHGQFIVDADHLNVAVAAMQAAGLNDLEFEFTETEK